MVFCFNYVYFIIQSTVIDINNNKLLCIRIVHSSDLLLCTTIVKFREVNRNFTRHLPSELQTLINFGLMEIFLNCPIKYENKMEFNSRK